MKVYVVMYGQIEEGGDETTLRVFADKVKAEAYRDAYKEPEFGFESYAYAMILEREVE